MAQNKVTVKDPATKLAVKDLVYFNSLKSSAMSQKLANDPEWIGTASMNGSAVFKPMVWRD